MNGSDAAMMEEEKPGAKALQLISTELLFLLPVEEVAEKILSRLNGEYSSIQTHVILHKMQEILDAAKEKNKDKAILECSPGNSFLGYEVKEQPIPARWEYDSPTLTHMEDAVKRMKKMLQGLTAEVVDPATGELLKPAKKIGGGATLRVQKVKV